MLNTQNLFVNLTLLRAQTSDPNSMRRSKYDVRLFMTAYIKGVIPVICNSKSGCNDIFAKNEPNM